MDETSSLEDVRSPPARVHRTRLGAKDVLSWFELPHRKMICFQIPSKSVHIVIFKKRARMVRMLEY